MDLSKMIKYVLLDRNRTQVVYNRSISGAKDALRSSGEKFQKVVIDLLGMKFLHVLIHNKSWKSI